MGEKDGFNKFIGLVILLILLTLIKGWFNFTYAIVWFGALAGYYFPFLDHIFYAYITRPEAEVSRGIRSYISIKNLISVKKWRELASYINFQSSRFDKLIIHTFYFQLVFVLVAFFVLSSSGSFFSRGLVYGVFLKLFVEQVIQFRRTKEINKWFLEAPIVMNVHKTKVYLYANGLALLIFTLML